MMDSRYARQIILPEVGIEGQQKIKDTKVLIIGAGGLGCPVIQYLSTAGVGTIGIIDHDLIEESNLSRQPLFSAQDIGKHKATIAAQKAEILNPTIKIYSYVEKFTEDNAGKILAEYDLIADCTDNFAARYVVNDVCMKNHKPWIFAAIEGWSGQIAVFNYKGGPTYRDIFPDAPENSDNCNSIGVMATLPAVIGAVQANEILKCILGAEGVLSGRMMVFNLLNHEISYLKIKNHAPLTEKHQIEINWREINPDDYEILDIRPEVDINQPSVFRQKAYYELSPADFLPTHKYLLICETGKKSRIVAEKLKKENSNLQIFSLIGGLTAITD